MVNVRYAIAASLAISLSACLLGMGGCSQNLVQSVQKTVQDLNQNIQDLETVKQALMKHYTLSANNVNVSIVGNAFDMKQASVRSLTVQMINAPAGQLESSAQEQAALEIARIAYKSYSGSLDPTNVVIIFVEHKNYFVLQYNSTSAPYRFERSQLVGEGA